MSTGRPAAGGATGGQGTVPQIVSERAAALGSGAQGGGGACSGATGDDDNAAGRPQGSAPPETRSTGHDSAPGKPRAAALVLGIGNELFTDEGLGCVAARQLAQLDLPGVQVLDGATLGLALLPELAGREAVLILDAVVGYGTGPGDLLVLHGEQVPANRHLTVSAHQIGISEALAAAELAGCAPPRLAAVGMAPASLDTGYGLSPLVQAQLPRLVEAARQILRDWGIPGA